MIRKAIKKEILSQKQKADVLIQGMTNKEGVIPYESFYTLFKSYVAVKFFLEVDEIVTDNFYDICQVSVDKVLSMPQDERHASLLASKCGGATDAMNKKVFFIMAVKKEFSIDIDTGEAVAVDTLQQLAQLVYSKARERFHETTV